MKSFLLTCLLLLKGLIAAYGQYNYDAAKVSVASRRIAGAIIKENRLMGSAVSAGGERPQQYDHFEKLREVATVAELSELTRHPNGVVRCYAFWALATHKEVDLFPFVLAHIHDTAGIETMFGCIVSEEQVGDIFVYIVRPGYFDADVHKLDSIQSAQLDSIMICTPNQLDSKASFIYHAPPRPALYPAIRKLVTEAHNTTALVPLARYRNPQDVPLILAGRDTTRPAGEGYYYTYEAISNFPHPDFFPLLQNKLEQSWQETRYTNELQVLYRALASYKNDKACALLQQSLLQVTNPSMRRTVLDFVTQAASAYKCPAYDSLLWILWTEEKQLYTPVFDYLRAKDPQRAYEAAQQTLLQPEAYNIGYDYGNEKEPDPVSLIRFMLDDVLERDRAYGLDLIRDQIRNGLRYFYLFADKAAALKERSLVDPLLERMLKEDNANIYLKAAKTLIAYKDKTVNARIAAAHKHIPDHNWGKKEYETLLKKNGIR